MKGIDGWLDGGRTYFTLESGLSFVIPGSGSRNFEAVEVPNGADDLSKRSGLAVVGDHIKELGRRLGLSRPASSETKPTLVGHHIVEVFRRLYRGDDSGESCVLQRSNDVFVTETIVAPHGTGAVCLYVYSRTEWEQLAGEEWELVSFWNGRPPGQ